MKEDRGGEEIKDEDLKQLQYDHSSSILASYNSERRPVALRNAHLSERNFNRSLKVAKAVGLDSRYVDIIGSVVPSKGSFFGLNLFETVLSGGMSVVLGNLKDWESNIWGRRVARNIQDILQKGDGLPLLFPRFELCEVGEGEKNNVNDDDDTAEYESILSVKHRLPHCSFINKNERIETSIDLSEVVSNSVSPCPFILIVNDGNVHEWIDEVQRSNLNIVIIEVCKRKRERNSAEETKQDAIAYKNNTEKEEVRVIQVIDEDYEWDSYNPHQRTILVRPDNIVCAIFNSSIKKRDGIDDLFEKHIMG